MGKVKLWVDGTQIEAEEGQSVLNAALAADIYIPHICSAPRPGGQGGCKLCVVDIEGQDGPVCSCMTYVKEGMKVRTKGETLDAHPPHLHAGDDGQPSPVHRCRSFGNCEFQALQQYLSSVNHPGMREFHKETVNLNTNNPLIDRDNGPLPSSAAAASGCAPTFEASMCCATTGWTRPGGNVCGHPQ